MINVVEYAVPNDTVRCRDLCRVWQAGRRARHGEKAKC